MDDTKRRSLRAVGLAGLALLACSLTGCSLFVMAGKMLFGDPVLTSAFRLATGVDLTKSGEKALVICSAPSAIRSRFEGAEYEFIAKVARHLKKQGISVVNSNEVAEWMDNSGGLWNGPTELAQAFETDYIIHIDLKKLELSEDSRLSFAGEQSPHMYRSKIAGTVHGYKVEKSGEIKRAWEVFTHEFSATYPEHRPFSRDEISSPEVFTRTCVDRASIRLAQLFYDHRMSEEIQ